MNNDDFPPLIQQRRANKHAQEQSRRERAELLQVFGSREGQLILTRLERRFETDFPAFQGKLGHYDPLDAMRRDAHREVFLTIRHQLEQARVEATKPTH